MKKYDVIVSHVADDFIWNLYERATEQIIGTYLFEEDAHKAAEFMERGGAFDGFTPSFVLTVIPDHNVNAKFERFIA